MRASSGPSLGDGMQLWIDPYYAAEAPIPALCKELHPYGGRGFSANEKEP